jgi:hypothetical protein
VIYYLNPQSHCLCLLATLIHTLFAAAQKSKFELSAADVPCCKDCVVESYVSIGDFATVPAFYEEAESRYTLLQGQHPIRWTGISRKGILALSKAAASGDSAAYSIWCKLNARSLVLPDGDVDAWLAATFPQETHVWQTSQTRMTPSLVKPAGVIAQVSTLFTQYHWLVTFMRCVC